MLVSFTNEEGINVKVETFCYTEEEKKKRGCDHYGIVFYRDNKYVLSFIMTDIERELILAKKMNYAKDIGYIMEIWHDRISVCMLSYNVSNTGGTFKRETFDIPFKLFEIALVNPTPSDYLCRTRPVKELIPTIEEKSFQERFSDDYLLQITSSAIRERTSYGIREEIAMFDGHIIYWFNAIEKWFLDGTLIRKNDKIKLDANQVLFYGTREQFHKLQYKLPPLPLYKNSFEYKMKTSRK